MEGISSTPISTPTATVDSSIGTTNSPSPTPVPQSLPPLPEDDDGISKRKNSSIVWQHFEKMKNPDGSWMKPARSKCKYCPQTYASCSRSNGTSAMRTHVMFQCRKSPIYVPNKKQKFLTFDSAAASRSVTMPRIDCKEELSEEDSHAANLHQFKLLRQEKDVVVIKNELDKYLMEASEEPSNPKFEILAWWKENAPRYPILSQIAKDMFAVPASTVASESAFSLGKRVVDPFRASLTPSMVEGLVCLSDWLRGAGFDAYKEPTKDELQLYEELEKLEIDGGSGVLSDSEE